MDNRAGRNGAALSLLIVSSLVLGGLFAVIIANGPVAQAGTCDQVGGVITGDWTITNAQVCSGIVYSVDGTININAGGSLTLVNGGLSFSKDTNHAGYALNVNAGGQLVLDNSIVTTQTNAISPYLKLGLTVSGANSRFVMQNGAILKFPGWFNATGANLNITGSTITGFFDSELAGLGLDTDDNNDGPVIAWSGTSASLYHARIDRIYEYNAGSPEGVQLSAASNLYAYDSYIGVDYASNSLAPGTHNDLRVDATSNAYLYNVSIDRSQDPADRSTWQPAFLPTAAGASVFLLRWLHATVLDASGVPVRGATIWSSLSPSATTAQYPDNGLSSTPSSQTLWYLGRTASGASAWNATDANGMATIPLYTDQITTASLPNAESFGNYQETATYASSTAGGSVSFNPYPSVSEEDNNRALTMSMGALQFCPTGVTTWSFNRQIVGMVSVSSCLEISGSVTISAGGLYIDQGSSGHDRAYVKILSGGTLTLANSVVWSNFPLAFYVADGGSLVTNGGSTLSLTSGGVPGLLRQDGPTSSVSLVDASVDGNVALYGGSVNLVRDTFSGPSLWIDSVQKTNLWDAFLGGVTSLGILTDDGNVNTVDVDIRNTTFDSVQTSQLVFSGTQNVQLTSVQTYTSNGDWWTGMITGGATVSRYWWLRIAALDGTGNLLAGTIVNLTVRRMDPNLLIPVTVPTPAAGDIYYTSASAWPVSAPRGFIVYRAYAETRSVSARTVNNSYIATGTVFLDATTYTPDADGQGIVASDSMMNLTFRVNAQNQPDLAFLATDYLGTQTVTQNQPFSVYVLIHNLGRTTAFGVTVTAYLNGNLSAQVGRLDGITVAASSVVNRTLNVTGIALAGTQQIEIIVDPFNQIFEGTLAKEANNFANITLNVQPPHGNVIMSSPPSGASFAPGTAILVSGFVRDQSSNPIVGLPLTIALQSGGSDIVTNTTVSQAGGFFQSTITIPSSLANGQYNVVVTPGSGIISPVTSSIEVKKPVSLLDTPVPILGIPYWLLFIILAAAAAIVIGVTLYWKVYGLGKMVECGECGAFIPEDATTCPKCGVEFEKDMAKCSNCQAWIPVDVKQCPECGVEFATGQVEMADYQEKMRLQYDEVVTKFKEEANRQLGRTLSDREFQEWWRKQPTFLTFEDWLREEEEMRKMGSKPCPVCGTLNSVTATVCHKCGSLMRDQQRPPSGGGSSGGGAAVIQTRKTAAPPSSDAPSGGQASSYGTAGAQPSAPGGTEAIPRRVIRKPLTPQPVVQKKIIKKPMGEGQEGEDQSDASGNDNASDDEL